MNKITLTINKRKLDFHFGLAFLGNALDELNLTINDIGERISSNPFSLVPKLMFLSASYALERKGEEVDFNQVEFIDWLDEDGGFANDNFTKFINAFTSSLVKDVPKDKNSKGSKKK